MGGSACTDGDWEFGSSLSEVRTLVLVGKTGNGKSATGNSILRTRGAFKSKTSSGGVTTTCKLERTVLEDGQILNVIDTPGLFDSSVDPEIIRKEIVECIKMAKNGIHAVLFVLSIRSRFSKEEENVVESLRKLFGSKIIDYMIVVFTGGDDLEENGETLDDYLGHDCPEALMETLKMCGNRMVLFDNKTKDEVEKSDQLKQLLSLVNDVVDENGGRPFTNELFIELQMEELKLRDQIAKANSKQEISELNDQLHKSYEEQLTRMTELIETKLKETTHRLELQLAKEQAARAKAEEIAQAAQTTHRLELQLAEEQAARARAEEMSRAAQTTHRLELQLAEEQAARAKAEAMAQAAQTKANEETENMRNNLERAHREAEELRRRAEGCRIL